MNHHIPIHPTFTKMTTSTRPHGLPPELPDPPTPPQGFRGVYREPLHGFYAPVDIMVCFGESYWQKVTARCAYETHNSAIEYIPLRKAPAGVADVPEGFEFYQGDVKPGGFNYGDVKLYATSEWQNTSSVGKYAPNQLAFRIGSEIHHRHFDAQPEQPAPADESLHDEKYNERVFGVPSASEQPAAEEFRYFKDSYGFQWKMPVDGKSGWMMAKGGLWLKCISKLSHIDKDWLRDGFYETDADGNPLVATDPITKVGATSNKLVVEPAKAREWEIFQHDSYGIAVKGLIPAKGETVFVREILPNEPSLLEEAVVWQTMETAPKNGTRILAGSRGCRVSVHYWNSNNHDWRIDYADGISWPPTHWMPIPECNPIPEPVVAPFDMDKLWSELPSWIQWVAMDETGDWLSYDKKPRIRDGIWCENSDIGSIIPPEFAPPPAADWKTSLIQRPTPKSHE